MIQPTPSHFTVLKNGMMGPIYHLLVGMSANGYPFSHLPTNKSYSPHHRTFQYCKVRWCGLYHLLVGICENGYPLAHIPTEK